jgi:Mo-dependent nitrogenase C-terminus
MLFIVVRTEKVIMSLVNYTVKLFNFSQLLGLFSQKQSTSSTKVLTQSKFDPFQPLRCWLDRIDIQDPQLAHRLCKLIPTQCPFERQISLLGRTLIKIPPLCKLNPLYDEVVALRFRAICYLADECGVDISAYC